MAKFHPSFTQVSPKVPAMKFTEKAIERLSTAKSREIGDDATTGLYLRIGSSGRKVWRYRYRLEGKTRIITLGNWPDIKLTDAREKATAYKRKVADGIDPAGQMDRKRAERRGMPTVEQFVPEYMTAHAKPKKKSWKQDQQMLDRWVIPAIGTLKMDEVKPRDVVLMIDGVKESGATRQPGKVLATVKMIFKIAVQRGVLDASPAVYVTESQPEPTRRAMSEAQIRHWWQSTGDALKAAEPPVRRSAALSLRLLLLTGQRPSEVADMTRDELHLDSPHGPYWLIAPERRKKGRAKTGKPHAVALEPAAVEIIKQAMSLTDSKHVFAREDGSEPRLPEDRVSSLYEDMAVALERLFAPDPHPTPHAARHTVATELEEMDVDEYRIGRVLGHSSKTVTGTVYVNKRINERALKSQRQLIAAWHARLMQMVDGKHTDNVVSIIG